VLTIVRAEADDAFDPSVRIFAETLASQAALAFEHDRSRLNREERTLVGDRERIARDLHDLVIQRLFATGLGLQSTLALIDEPIAYAKVSRSVDMLDETIKEIRNTIFRLAPSDAGPSPIRSEILALAREARTAFGFEPSVGFDGPLDTLVPDEVLPHVLACVREALSNIARHARASAVRIELVLTDDSLCVTVIDDGVGIGSTTHASGLANLAERAQLCGGNFVVNSPVGGGTRLEWKVPV
jgi:signal transduction histidine kinase